MVLAVYEAGKYGGKLKDCLIYSEFYEGWVRRLGRDRDNNILSDDHLGHLTGMTSL